MEEDEMEDEEEEDVGGAWRGKRGAPCVRLREGRSQKRRCTRPHSLDLGTLLSHRQEHTHTEAGPGEVRGEVGGFWRQVEAGLREQASRLRADLALSRQEGRELQERLMVSEATVHAQAEQLKDYRELLTETSVPQASKQVQVDLQDLGYETSGRSENEAEREDTSSPEFDDLEMCTTLSHQQDFEGGGWYHGDGSVGGAYEEGEDPGPDSLQQLVEDLRSQLSRCHKVIRGLQLRVRSLSSTSDYASSLERTPRKVNWAFEASPVASGLEEDEGWASDSLGPRLEPKPSRELRELVSRVASLEAQLKSSRLDGKGGLAEEEKCATWPGKYNTLIQAQARELSHLRQRMREGRGVCHILTQHLGDTTKAFEELLRANDIDYYMGQSFREQLAQSSALAQRVGTKISGRDRAELQDDKMGHELLALRLSKELQQKDKIIESLHTKLQQRPDTPSSCHALSHTTDQSDRTSFVSDECRTNEDLELCSDGDAASEYQEEQRQGAGHGTRSAGFASPHVKTLSTLSAPAHPDPSHYSPVSHHAVQQYQLGYGSLKPHTGLATGGALWDMENMLQPIKSFSESGYHSGSNHTGVELMEEHLREARCLRQRLEESIRTNERLRLQLEERLAGTGRDGGAPTNIYIQGLDSVSQLSNEVRLLKEENLALQGRLQASAEACEDAGRLREAVLAGHARLKQAELEAGQWQEELRRLQAHSQEQSQHIHTLRLDRQACQERNHRLQQEVSLLQQQLGENRELLLSLQSELQVYDRVCAKGKGYLSEGQLGGAELGDLLGEVRNLRAQLQNSLQENSALKQLELHKQLEQRLGGGGGGGSPRTPSLPTLTASPQRDSFYRRQLLHDPAPSPPVRDIGLFTCGSPYVAPPFGGPPYGAPPYTGPYPDLEDSHSTVNDPLDPHSDLEGEAPDGSFSNPNGRHAVGHVDDFSSLQQQVLEGRSLVQRMETALSQSLVESGQEQALDYVCVRSLLSDTRTLRQILEESVSLLRMFWRAALPSSERSLHILKKERGLQEELVSLTLRMAEKEEVLQETVMRLRSTSRTKESMEHFIVNQLSRTRDVLKKARTNLEKNELRLSSLSSSSSPYTVEEPGSASRERPTHWGFLKLGDAPEVAVATGRKRGSQCLLEAVTC